MNIDSLKLKQLRNERHWSQDHLATLSGLNLRTIQRLEAGAKISKESLKALAAVLEVPAESLLVKNVSQSINAVEAIREGICRSLDFNGTTKLAEFWWFTLGMIMFLAFAKILSATFGQLVFHLASLLVLLPWISVCTRRLRDAGINVWYQLVVLIPVIGILILLFLLSVKTKKIKLDSSN